MCDHEKKFEALANVRQEMQIIDQWKFMSKQIPSLNEQILRTICSKQNCP